jgi:hypothetical protein
VAIAHIEVDDKAGMQFTASGVPTQQDCVDEATNTTSYLLVLQANGLLKQHTVGGTMSKENLARGLVTPHPVKYWPHFAAVLITRPARNMRSIPGCSIRARPPAWSRTGKSRTASRGPLASRKLGSSLPHEDAWP